MKIRVYKNIYGNFRGYITGDFPYDIGSNEFDAKMWMLKIIENPNANVSVSIKSHFSFDEIMSFKNSLKI